MPSLQCLTLGGCQGAPCPCLQVAQRSERSASPPFSGMPRPTTQCLALALMLLLIRPSTSDEQHTTGVTRKGAAAQNHAADL